jgi:hypothetical protein
MKDRPLLVAHDLQILKVSVAFRGDTGSGVLRGAGAGGASGEGGMICDLILFFKVNCSYKTKNCTET